jgi:hypothetical protein
VIGRSFSFQILLAICQIDVDELFNTIEKSQQVGLIVSSAEGPEKPFTFAHELVRQTLLSDISEPRRQRLHLAAAAAIEELERETLNEQAALVAYHLRMAGRLADPAKTAKYFWMAGKLALEAAAYQEHHFDGTYANPQCSGHPQHDQGDVAVVTSSSALFAFTTHSPRVCAFTNTMQRIVHRLLDPCPA